VHIPFTEGISMSLIPRTHKFIPLLFGFLIVLRPVPAQPTNPPTLGQILQRLEDNLVHYHSVVPSFFCDEHVVSRQSVFGKGRTRAVTDSTFRLKRTLNGDGRTILAESREVKAINGKPAKADSVAGPVVLEEAFSSGLALVSISQTACMRYTLEPIKPDNPILIEFSSFPGKPGPSCLLQERGAGRVLIDPATLQILRLELAVPHHIIVFGSKTEVRMEGPWTVAVDYAPVELEGQTFWMPKRILSTALAPGSDGGNWLFNATYSNFHKLEVTSQILPVEIAPTQ
jgi:hypothetical protein